MPVLIAFKDAATTTLVAAVNATQTTIPVVNASLLPSTAGGFYFYATLADQSTGGANNREVIKVTNIVGNNLTVVRGQGGYAPSIFNAGDLCDNRVCAQALADIAAAA